MTDKANDIIKRVEDHCGDTIKPKRLRFHIIETLQREINKRESLERRIHHVLNGAATYNPKTHKSIHLPK